ncbi:amino acid ABC transporter permease [Glaciimonas soli]|uniref:ABC transporter permease subunit n=1 Tax=Glaciimonas soli TaxID=2590999 RepID=A0A843YRS9_9BURK|nr:amino acid ABC transporter permease [Glaciimonas soli]MQR00208.1 ABC transporter permease subunit [Glaciimonas soli]
MSKTTLLYEPAGPKATRRNEIYTWTGRLLIVSLTGAIALRLAERGQFDAVHWAVFSKLTVWKFLFIGLLGTLKAAALSTIFSLVLAFPIAFGRLSENFWFKKSAEMYISLFRAIPLLLLILFMTVLLPVFGFAWPGLAFLVIAMTLHHSALTAEIVRSGILSLERGQREAALSIGMNTLQAMSFIILPQALKRMMPTLIGQFLSVVQDTSLGYIIPYNELLRSSQLITSYAPETLLSSAFISTMLYGIVSAALLYLQRSLKFRTIIT